MGAPAFCGACLTLLVPLALVSACCAIGYLLGRWE